MPNYMQFDNLTPEQWEAMKSETRRLFDQFGVSGLHHLVNVFKVGKGSITPNGVQKWSEKGFIPANKKTVHDLCQIPPIKEAGFTRESLRPDIVSWVEFDYPLEEV